MSHVFWDYPQNEPRPCWILYLFEFQMTTIFFIKYGHLSNRIVSFSGHLPQIFWSILFGLKFTCNRLRPLKVNLWAFKPSPCIKAPFCIFEEWPNFLHSGGLEQTIPWTLSTIMFFHSSPNISSHLNTLQADNYVPHHFVACSGWRWQWKTQAWEGKTIMQYINTALVKINSQAIRCNNGDLLWLFH